MIYLISTKNFNWEVKRTFGDFIWLRNTLLKLFPGHYIPSLFEKKNKDKTKQLIISRIYILDQFVKRIVSLPDLLQNEYTYAFLQQSDDKIFLSSKKVEKILYQAADSIK